MTKEYNISYITKDANTYPKRCKCCETIVHNVGETLRHQRDCLCTLSAPWYVDPYELVDEDREI